LLFSSGCLYFPAFFLKILISLKKKNAVIIAERRSDAAIESQIPFRLKNRGRIQGSFIYLPFTTAA